MSVTIYDIAKEAKTSISTVSRYLNGKSVKTDTATRIKSAIDKYHYSPSMLAQGLVHKSLKTIAIVMPDIRVYHYSQMSYIIEQYFSKKGYAIILCNFPFEPLKAEGVLKTLLSRKIEAIVFISSFFDSLNKYSNVLNLLKDVHVVTENCKLDLENSYSVSLDEEECISEALDYLISRNRKNIAYIQDTNSLSGNIRKMAFVKNYSKINPECLKNVYFSIRSPLEGYKTLLKIKEENPTIDAVIYEEDVTAIGGLKAQRELKISNDDFDIVGFNRNNYSEVYDEGLCLIDTMDIEQAELICKVLDDCFASKPIKNKNYLVKPVLIPKVKK